MPLNGNTYLVQHGWAGKGVALDGESGRGLKKPIALPMKRNVKGLGKERDRATEWWDCVFEAGAKKMQQQKVYVGGTESTSNSDGHEIASSFDGQGALSLVAIAKRQHARKLLMTGFIRGRESEYEKQEKKAAAELIAQAEFQEGDDNQRQAEKNLRRAERRTRKAAKSALKDAAKAERRRRKHESEGAKLAKLLPGLPVEENEDKMTRKKKREESRDRHELP